MAGLALVGATLGLHPFSKNATHVLARANEVFASRLLNLTVKFRRN
jgi:hypothetical protein